MRKNKKIQPFPKISLITRNAKKLTNITQTMKPFSQHRPAGAIKSIQIICLICSLIFPFLSNATTPEEDKLFHAPMPHEYLGHSGTKLKVHRVRMDGYMESEPDNQAQLLKWKQGVKECIAYNAEHGRSSNPPADWPKYTLGMRTDTYVAANRVISYSTVTAYGFNPDCSLRGVYGSTAQLLSTKGSCYIDLVKKTTRGVCDASGHTDAIVQWKRLMPDNVQSRANIDKMAADPRYAAMFAGVRRELARQTPTGQTKTLAGVKCEVFNQIPRSEGGNGGTICLLLGGELTPPVTGLTAAGRIGIEVDGEIGAKLKAVDVSLDTEVSDRIFVPYLDAGFSVTSSAVKTMKE
jgi:hypothetical protein